MTLPYFSETIEATVTKRGTKVLCDNELQNIYHCDLDRTEGQGHKGQGHRSGKVTLPYFSETIEATVTKHGTKVLYDNALLNTHITVTMAEGQGHKGQGQRSRKVTLPYFSETIEATITKLGTKVLCDNALQTNVSV